MIGQCLENLITVASLGGLDEKLFVHKLLVDPFDVDEYLQLSLVKVLPFDRVPRLVRTFIVRFQTFTIFADTDNILRLIRRANQPFETYLSEQFRVGSKIGLAMRTVVGELVE